MKRAFKVKDRVLINASGKAKKLSYLEQAEITVTFVEDGFFDGIADDGRTYSNISFNNAKLILKCGDYDYHKKRLWEEHAHEIEYLTIINSDLAKKCT